MLYAKHTSGKLGSDYTMITDLKTVRGVENRLSAGRWPAGDWEVFQCTKEDWYKDNHKRVAILYKRAPHVGTRSALYVSPNRSSASDTPYYPGQPLAPQKDGE